MNDKKTKLFTTIRVFKNDADIMKSMSKQLSPPNGKMDFAELVNEAVRQLHGVLTGKQKTMSAQEYELIENGKIAELEKKLVERWDSLDAELRLKHLERQLTLDKREMDLNIREMELASARDTMLHEQRAVAAVCSVLSRTAALNELISMRNLPNWQTEDYHSAADAIMKEQPAQLERMSQTYAKKAIETVNREGIPEIPESTGLLDRVLSKLGIAKSKESEHTAANDG